MNWLIASLVALVCWGIWGLLLKLATKYYSWYQIFIITNIVTIIVTLIVFIFFFDEAKFNLNSLGFSYALLAGLMGSVAPIALLYAIEVGKAMIVVPITALYPVITIILSFLILHEEISPTKGFGIILGLVALFLVSID